MKIRNSFISLFFISITILIFSCKNTETIIQNIYDNTSKSDKSYQVLSYLCSQTAGRLPGTKESEKAIEYLQKTLKEYSADSVWLFPVTSPGWREVKKPVVELQLKESQKNNLNAVSLGQSISSGEEGVKGQIVVITDKAQIDSLGKQGLNGKIVFFNQKMQVRSDYGKMVWQRVYGASMVSKYGAVGVLVRSLTTKYDDNPHAGVMRYDEKYPKIPAVAISWESADFLEKQLNKNPDIVANIEVYTENPGFINSNNVLAEIKGCKYPDKILLLTAHLDAWHNTQGAHDDGGGISQIIDVIRIFKELKIKPKHTIRVMPYMDEEQTLSGMRQFADGQKNSGQKHLLDIEVDYGVGVPTGYNIQVDSSVFKKQKKWRKLLKMQNLNSIKITNSYAQSWPLFKTDSTVLAHLVCEDDHYFDYHHSQNDVIEAINKSSLQSGSAALAAFIYLIDKLEVIKP